MGCREGEAPAEPMCAKSVRYAKSNHARMSRFSKILLTAALLIAASLACQTSPAAEWPDMRVYGPFVCRADFALDRQQGLLSELGELQTELVQTLQIAPAKEPIEVYLFHDEETYRRYLKRIYPTLPFRQAFFIKEHGLGRVFAYESSQFEADLRHECTHALLHAVLPVVPSGWTKVWQVISKFPPEIA